MKTSRMQSKPIDPARISVLKASGRAEDYVGVSRQKEAKEPEQTKPASAVVEKLLSEFRQAAG